jgi:hypothetical protein
VQPDLQRRAVQGVIDALALVGAPALPHIHQLIGKVAAHVVAKHLAQVVQQLALRASAKELKRAAVDVEHLDAGQAFVQQARVRGQMSAQVHHTLPPQPVEDALNGAVVFLPQRDRRKLKQIAGQRVGQ